MKKILALSSLVLLVFGCSNKGEINIKNFDLEKADNVEIIKRTKDNDSLKGYGIINKNYTIINETGTCNVANQIESDSDSKKQYYIEAKQKKIQQDNYLDIYLRENQKCSKIQRLEIANYEIDKKVNKDELYINLGFKDGLKKVTKDKVIVFKDGKDGVGSFAINKDGNVYAISATEKESSLIKFNKDGKLIEEVKIDKNFNSLYLFDNKISMIGSKMIKEIEDGSSQDYNIIEGFVETYDLDKVFKDIKDHKGEVKDFGELNGNLNIASEGTKTIALASEDKSIICDKELNECTTYPNYTYMVDDKLAIIKKDSKIYLHKLGTNEVEHILDNEEDYLVYRVESKDLYLGVIKNGETKTIKYTLK